MVRAGKELVLLCSILIIQHVTGNSHWCSRGRCYPYYGWCGSYDSNNCGPSNYGGWNEHRYQNCYPFYQRVSNEGEECCDSNCRTGLSDLMNTLGYGRWINLGTGYGWNNLGSTASYNGHNCLGFIARNGDWINLRRSNDYSGHQNNGAVYNMWNTPNRFSDYARWKSQDYGTTSYDGLNILTNTGELDGVRTQGYGTTMGQNNRAGYNTWTWNSPNRFSDYAGWNSLRYGTKPYDELNSFTDSAVYAGSNSLVSPARYGGLTGQKSSTGDGWESLRTGADYNRQKSLSSRIDSNTRRISNNVADYADWNSLVGASSYDGWNTLASGTGYDSTLAKGWNDRLKGGTGYEGLNSQGTVIGYDGSNIFANSAGYEGLAGQGSSTETGWNSITTDGTSRSQSTGTHSVTGYDGWNTMRIGAGYNPWNNLNSATTLEEFTPVGYITSSVAVNDWMNGLTRGNILEGLDGQYLNSLLWTEQR